MPYCARLTYASTTTSKPSALRQDLLDILEEARVHNFNQQIHGVLYYGNNYFFQCIEGRKTQVNELYQKISKDRRHRHVVLLSYQEIERPSLQDWQMKYVYHDETVQQFFSQHQWEKFNPYALKEDLIDEFMALLIPHENMEAGQHEKVEWVHIKERGQGISRIIPWLLIVTLSVLILFCLYYSVPINNSVGTGFFNNR